MTQESIFIGLIGFSRSKFQDFEARILVLTSSWPQILRWNLISTQFCNLFFVGKIIFLIEKWPEKWAFLTKCSSDSDSAHRELSFRYGLASSGAHGAELWRFFIISKKLFKNRLLRQFCRPLYNPSESLTSVTFSMLQIPLKEWLHICKTLDLW